jgi:hypothetical protein
MHYWSCADYIFRIRKVKCDEAKPYCNRCTSTGRTCDGYDVNFRPPSHSPTNTPPSNQGHLHPNRELTRSISPISLAPALHLKTAEEWSGFEFFATHAISSLRGFLQSSFWQREILQAAHQNESIQHCIVALGAMHRRFLEGRGSHINESDMADRHLQFALLQSNQAIKGLVKTTGPGGRVMGADKVTLMTCAVLFTSMACLQGHQKEALQHLRSGIRLLNEMDHEDEDDKTGRHPVDVESLRSIMVGLDLQARLIMSTKDMLEWEPPLDTKEPFISPEADVNDATLVTMYLRLQGLNNTVLSFVANAVLRPLHEADTIHSEYRRLLKRFDTSTNLLQKLCSKVATSTGDLKRQTIALQLFHSQLEFFLRAPRDDLEKKFNLVSELPSNSFDRAKHFTKMLDLAFQLLPSDASASLSPVFTTSMGPLSALWLIASRAPSACITLRKRAVELMLSYPRREGFWDGLLAGQIAQTILGLEQEFAQEELGLESMPIYDLIVPDDLRIMVIALQYDEQNDRRATVEYRTVRDMALNQRGKIQLLRW